MSDFTPAPFFSFKRHDVKLREPFQISGYTFDSSPILVVTLTRGGHIGRGEAAGVYYTGDTADRAVEAIHAVMDQLGDELTRESLRSILPAGTARSAIDGALWELEAREAGLPVWKAAGLEPPRPLLTTVTLGVDEPGKMAEAATKLGFARALKLKLSGETEADCERVRAVRAVRPDVWMGVDPNQGYTPATIDPLIRVLVDSDVKLLEQPFRRGHEYELDGLRLPLPVAADESCLDLAELETMAGRFDVINIKLDKCGGLTEGLLMARRAQALGLKVMVGNMMGTSLSVAPAFLLGQLCDIVDLDGPLFLAQDHVPGVTYDDGYIDCPPAVWGDQAQLATDETA